MTIYELINQTMNGLVGSDWTNLLLPAILVFVVLLFLKR